MSNHHICAHEVILLLTWLSAPALLFSLAVLSFVFGQCGMFRSGRVGRAILALATYVIGILIVALTLWLFVPNSLWNNDVLLPNPGLRGLFLPPLFAPAIVAALLLVPLTGWFTIRGLTNRSSQPLAVAMRTFDFMKPFFEFATLAPASGGPAPSR